MQNLIVLMTDFGLKDSYVGVMKGVMKGIAPDLSFIDLTHAIHPQDVIQGAFVLENSYAYFPCGTIFMCVVDPGVGTTRRAIAIRTQHYYFVGPDNGLLRWAAERDGIREVRLLENPKFWRTKHPSYSFHGRDIFSPVAAHLHQHLARFRLLGPVVKSIKRLKRPSVLVTNKRLTGQILHFDHFGNAMTNITKDQVDRLGRGKRHIHIGKKVIEGISLTYASHKKEGAKAIFNSCGLLEIAIQSGSAQKQLKLKLNQKVIVL